MSDVLTLSELLGRSISVEWQEAVAIVRGVAACLLEDPVGAPKVPELHQIEISSEGRIDIVGGTSTAEPVRRLGQLLQATLGNSEPPVQLRLVISQATAPNPSFGSVREYDQALEYFERPDRSGVLRALYARAAAAPSLFGPKATLDSIAPLATPEQQDKARIRAEARRRSMRLVAGAGFLVIVCAAGVQYARVAGVMPGAGRMLAIAQRISKTLGATILSSLSTITERSGLGRLVSKDVTDVESPAAVAESPPPPSAVPQSATSRSNPQTASNQAGVQRPPLRLDPKTSPFVAFDLEPAGGAAVPPPPVPDGDAAPASGTPSNEASAPEGKDELTVYSAESAGVLPPVSVRPQLPTELPSTLSRENLLAIELIVLPDGSVGSVRLLRAPTQMSDAIWLSAVKAFEFRPAMKDGVPVRYRKTVWIASH